MERVNLYHNKSNKERGLTMRDFFSLDGPFNKYGGMVADMLILSLMWLLFSIPFITIGASTTALFFVTTRRIANREGYITRDFWESFKSNLKRATLIWILIIAIVWLIWFNINNLEIVGTLGIIIFPIQIVVLIELILTSIYIFPITARFDMAFKESIRSSFFMANRHLLTSITCFVLLVSAVGSFFIVPPIALFLAPGIYAWLSSHMIMRIIKKYRPEVDRDPVLEIQEIEARKIEERRKRSIGSISSNSSHESDEIEQTEDIWTTLANTEPDPDPIVEDISAENIIKQTVSDDGSYSAQNASIVEVEIKSKAEIEAKGETVIKTEDEINTDTEISRQQFIDSLFDGEELAEETGDIWSQLRDAGNDSSDT